MTNDNYKNIDEDKNLNQRLQLFIQQAQNHQIEDAERRRKLSKWLYCIENSGKLGHPLREQIPSEKYMHFYDEALQRTREYIVNNIDMYNPQYPVMAWVNQVLKWRLKDVIREYKCAQIRVWSLDEVVENFQKSEVKISNKLLSGLLEANQQSWVRELERLKTEEFRHQIDNNYVFNQIYIQGNPQATFKKILLMKMDGMTFNEIAMKFNLSLNTVSSFYKRNLKKYSNELRTYMK